MKQLLILMILGSALAAGAGAQSLDAWAKDRATLKMSELTVADWKAFADAQSVERQQARYVFGASLSSFVLPGVGQFRVGDPLGGTLNLAAHLALVGGTIYGAWALLPSDLKGNLSRDERHDRFGDYLFNDPAKVAPSIGIVATGIALSVVQRFWASDDAKTKALANLESGKVTFEPQFDRGFGFRMRM